MGPQQKKKGGKKAGGKGEQKPKQKQKRRMTRSGQAIKGRLDQTGGERKVAVKVKLRTVARKKVVARRESSQSEVRQAPPVKAMRNRRTRSGPGSSEELTRERKHSQENLGSLTPCTVPTTQMTSKSTGGCTSVTVRRTA